MISVFMSISLWAQVAVLDVLHILEYLGQVNADYLQVLYLGRAPRTKETLPDFLKWRRVTRHPLVFRGLTGSQRTPGFWGVTAWAGRDKCTPSMRATCASCARDMHATSLLCTQQRPQHGHCAHSVRATWVLGVRTVHPTQFRNSALFRVTVWTLFMNTVHEHYSQSKKKTSKKNKK